MMTYKEAREAMFSDAESFLQEDFDALSLKDRRKAVEQIEEENFFREAESFVNGVKWFSAGVAAVSAVNGGKSGCVTAVCGIAVYLAASGLSKHFYNKQAAAFGRLIELKAENNAKLGKGER